MVSVENMLIVGESNSLRYSSTGIYFIGNKLIL